MSRAVLDELGVVVLANVTPACVVPTTLRVRGEDLPDDSGIVSGATPVSEAARARLREQALAQLTRDDAAVLARERRIACERGRVTNIRRRA